jgi:hypothetical protein
MPRILCEHPRRMLIVSVTIALFSLLLGCNNDPAGLGTNGSAVNDAAVSVANALSRANGGAFDQAGDIALITSSAGAQNEAGAILGKYALDSVVTNVNKTYDSISGWWTLTLYRYRSRYNRVSEFSREYQYQFLNKSSAVQKYWLTGSDTAYSIHFRIVSGTGYSIRPHLRHHLNSLTGEWLVTGTNTNTITINTVNNGPYMRAGSDTITTDEATRTLNYTLSLTFTDVTFLRGSRFDDDEEEHSNVSGTITGTYDATITFTKGSLYRERTIHETISITLGGENEEDGVAEMRLGDFHFRTRVASGDVD